MLTEPDSNRRPQITTNNFSSVKTIREKDGFCPKKQANPRVII
jgi:hypothetical protein